MSAEKILEAAPEKTSSDEARAIPDSVPSELLLGDKTLLKIRHNGDLYELRRTRQNKLILTK